jgi:hypothetical protein
MSSLFTKYDRNAQKKLENSAWPRKTTLTGELSMRISQTTNAKGIAQLFGDRFVFSTTTQLLADISMRWKQLDPFVIVDEDEQETEIGFTVRSASNSIDFIASSRRILNKWLRKLEKIMILTEVTEEYKLGKVVGSGSYGNVLKATKYGSDDLYAIK